MITLIAQSLWFIFPAYCANAFPLLIKGRRPLDFGKNFGRYRLLGNGKTIEGTLGGILFGILVGWLQINLQGYIPAEFGFTIFTVQLIVLLSAGAIAGDIIGAFIKRRLGIPRGYPAPLLDQLNFLVGALFLSSFVSKIGIEVVITLIILTPLIHLATNRIGYLIKVKKVPY